MFICQKGCESNYWQITWRDSRFYPDLHLPRDSQAPHNDLPRSSMLSHVHGLMTLKQLISFNHVVVWVSSTSSKSHCTFFERSESRYLMFSHLFVYSHFKRLFWVCRLTTHFWRIKFYVFVSCFQNSFKNCWVFFTAITWCHLLDTDWVHEWW